MIQKAFFLTTILFAFRGVSATPDIEVLRQRVISELMVPAVDEGHVEILMGTILEDGT